jgi:FkbM family methyltransferase
VDFAIRTLHANYGFVRFWSIAHRARSGGLPRWVPSYAANLLRLFVRALLKLNPDPIVRVNIGKRPLLIPWSHQLPFYLVQFPRYESEIGRLANFVHRTRGGLTMIDVGANVGDTVACLAGLSGARFLCIEALPRYFDLLRSNFEDDPHVVLEHALLGDGSALDAGLEFAEIGGTAHVEPGTGKDIDVPRLTLDALVDRCGAFREANLVKIDTDGFDLKVMRGGEGLFRSARPCLHVEFSPRHWRDYGGCKVEDGLEFLAGCGYDTLVLYDNHGYLIGRDSTREPTLALAFLHYALRHPGFYLNIIAFHVSAKDATSFFASELSLVQTDPPR